MTADQMAAFRLLYLARFHFMVDQPKQPRPAIMNHYPGSPDFYGYAYDRAMTAFGCDYVRDPETGHFTRDWDTSRRLFDAVDRRVAWTVEQLGIGPTRERAKAQAIARIRHYVERGDLAWHLDGMVYLRCPVHDRWCGKKPLVSVHRINGQDCCYQFNAYELERELKSGAKQLSLFGAAS